MRTMKTVRAIVVAAVFAGTAVWAQEATSVTSVAGLEFQASAGTSSIKSTTGVKDDLLAGTEKFAQNASKVTEINLDPSTMSMMGAGRGGEHNPSNKMKILTVHEYRYDKPGQYSMDDVEAVAKRLQGGNWSCPVTVRAKDAFTHICSRSEGDYNEMVVITANPQQVTFVHMGGNMPLDQLGAMDGAARAVTKGAMPH